MDDEVSILPTNQIHLDKESWEKRHERWHHIITASQAPTILGLNRFESPQEYYDRKLAGVRREKTIAMRRGHAMEPLIHELFEEQTGEKLIKPADYAMWTTPDMRTPEQLVWHVDVTPDRFSKSGRLVEFKAPLHQPEPEDLIAWKCQLKMQMFATGWRRGCLAILAGNDRLRIIEVEYDEKEMDGWLKILGSFVDCLYKGKPPTWGMQMPRKNEEAPFAQGVAVMPELAVDAAEHRFLGVLISELQHQQEKVRAKFVGAMRDKAVNKIISGKFTVSMHEATITPHTITIEDCWEEKIEALQIPFQKKRPYRTHRLSVQKQNEEHDEDHG